MISKSVGNITSFIGNGSENFHANLKLRVF